MLLLHNFKLLFMVIALWMIVAEARPKASPQLPDVPEVLVEELPPLEDTPIDADSFPLAPDVPNQGIDAFDDYHIHK